MAKYDVINVKGISWLALSNEQSVGVGGVNDIGDVMLIQAMLFYLKKLRGYNPPVVPAVTGIWDDATKEAIRFFQIEFSVRLIVSDGKIHPPTYFIHDSKNPRTRELKNMFKPLMTHTYLHLLCKSLAGAWAHGRYPNGIPGMFPQLHAHLKYPDMKNLYWLK